MSHIVPIDKVNQFLPAEKLELDDTPSGAQQLPADHNKIKDLEETGRDIVLGKLSSYYVTTGWFDQVDPPDLIITIVSMLVAGWVYDRQFAEEATEGASYGTRKIHEAYALLDKLLTGELVLFTDLVTDPARQPSTLETEPVFTMDERI